mgnify:FL=1
MATVTITGLDILRSQLRDLGERGARAAVRNAARRVATSVAKDAKGSAPVVTGALKKSIGVREVSREGAHIVGVRSMRVSVRGKRGPRAKNPAIYARIIDRRTGFMREAVEAGRAEAITRYRLALEEQIERIAARGLRARRR